MYSSPISFFILYEIGQDNDDERLSAVAVYSGVFVFCSILISLFGIDALDEVLLNFAFVVLTTHVQNQNHSAQATLLNPPDNLHHSRFKQYINLHDIFSDWGYISQTYHLKLFIR